MHPNHVLTIVVITSRISVLWRERFTPGKSDGARTVLRRQRSWNCCSPPTCYPVVGQGSQAEDLSATQYNVLRILRGSPAGLPCGEIASRMITRDPDVTRLLDRLEKRALISRCRETKDRRTVMARMTPEGLILLARLDEPVRAAHRKQLGHLGRDRLRILTELLRASRSQVA